MQAAEHSRIKSASAGSAGFGSTGLGSSAVPVPMACLTALLFLPVIFLAAAFRWMIGKTRKSKLPAGASHVSA